MGADAWRDGKGRSRPVNMRLLFQTNRNSLRNKIYVIREEEEENGEVTFEEEGEGEMEEKKGGSGGREWTPAETD